MIDIHSHLIPGVDDGSQSIDESLKLLNMAIEQGITHIFLTPHNDAFDYYDVLKRYYALFDEVYKRELPIKIHIGAEILFSPHSIKNNIYKIKNGIYPTLNGTRYVLMEFNPFNSFIEDALYCIRSIIDIGYKPVIAHAERYRFSHAENIKLLKNEGALIQINAYSLKNESLNKIKFLSRELMQKQMVDFIGSDAHRFNHRPFMVNDGIEYAYANYESDYVDKVMFGNAMEMLIGG